MGKYLKQIFICSLILSFGLVSTCLSASDTIDENKKSKKASVEQAGKEQSNPQEKDNKAEGETKADSLKSAFVFFPEPVFEFASEVEGAEVVHDFVIMNKGTDILKVEKVKTGWGCTTVSYSREIPPGGEGKITIKVNTKGYGGRKLMKTISVLTNDPKNPQTNITVSGNVEKFASITPSVIRLNGKIGEELKAEVKIVPESKFPFSISKVTAQEGKNIKYELKENKSESGAKEYLITVENLKKDAGFYYDVLTAATDSKVQPEIKINVMTRIIDPNAQQNQNLPLKSVNDSSKPNSFLEVIQKMQQQNGQKGNSADINTNASSDAVSKSDSASKNGGGQASAVVQDPKRSEELKKKFEALIKEAQEKQNAEAQQKNKEQPKTQAE